MITSHGRILKGRHDPLALLSRLCTSHTRKSEADTTLRRILRSAQKKAGGTEPCRIAQNLPVELGAHGQDMKFNRFAKCNRPQNYERPVPIVKAAHRSDGIAQQVQVFARGRKSSNGHRVHRMCLTQSALRRLLETNLERIVRLLPERDHFVNLSSHFTGGVLAVVLENRHRQSMLRNHGNLD